MRSFVKFYPVGLMVMAVLMLTPVITVSAHPSGNATKPPHISLQQARAVALKVFPGRIIKEELEREKGGSGLRYSFDIRHGKLIHEVGVDAETGKLLENSDDSSDND
jgi:uncharacterized membrane protein YkoI